MPDLENITIQHGIISWYQSDTMGIYCGCNCYFDYSVTIDSLNPGNYTAMIYSVYFSDTTFSGASNFTIASHVQCDNNIQMSSDASICHLPTLIRDIPKDNLIILNGSDYITVSTSSDEKILKISLISITGKEVYRTESESFTELLIPVESLTKGIHILTIVTDSGRYTRKIPVFR
ncbi:MAG: T9SS type A sorting domain-containing protein [Bacteroidota bacterium]